MSDSFAGRLFGPELPGCGVEATGRWHDDGSLLLAVAGRELEAATPEIGAAGFNAAGLRLSWRDDAGAEYLFFIETEAARAACLATAPPRYAPLLAVAAGHKKRVEHRFRLGWGLLLLLLLLPFSLFFLLKDDLAGWVVARIPAEQEARLGDLVLAQTRLQLSLLEDGPAVEAVREIGEQLTTGSKHRYRWLVADSAEVNAFAAPGGVVVVHAGLLREAGSAEELAGVLAHEIAHVELRHSLKTLVKGVGLQALAAVALGDLSGSAVAEAARQLTELRFSREAEREADRDGLRRLAAARIDPAGLGRFLEKLAAEGSPAPPPLFSTHPAPEERLAELRREADRCRGEWRSLAIDLQKVKAALPSP